MPRDKQQTDAELYSGTSTAVSLASPTTATFLTTATPINPQRQTQQPLLSSPRPSTSYSLPKNQKKEKEKKNTIPITTLECPPRTGSPLQRYDPLKKTSRDLKTRFFFSPIALYDLPYWHQIYGGQENTCVQCGVSIVSTWMIRKNCLLGSLVARRMEWGSIDTHR